jgi:methylthioribose-1-phosphate isomerase
VLDQLKIPFETVYVEVKTVQDGWKMINTMQVRGAPVRCTSRCSIPPCLCGVVWERRSEGALHLEIPRGSRQGVRAYHGRRVEPQAIAIVGVLSLAVEMASAGPWGSAEACARFIERQLAHLVTARPTAVNMGEAAKRMTALAHSLASKPHATATSVHSGVLKQIEAFLERDIADNKAIGEAGANAILARAPPGKKVTVLTHCNTGSLATAGYGTALGIIRSLHARGRLAHV